MIEYDLLKYVRETWGQEGKNCGREVMFSCQFHSHGTQDRTPSFAVYPATQSWYCFKEHVGGSTLNFVENYYQCDRAEAKRILSGDDVRKPPKLDKPYELPKEATLNPDLYEYYLGFKPHEAIEAYCATRAISPKGIDHFELGMRYKGAMRYDAKENKWEHTTHEIDGRKVGFPMCRYLTIPTKRFGEIVHIAFRRDDGYANFLYDNMPEKIRLSLEKKYGDRKSAIDQIWTRFTSQAGGTPNIFNSSVIGRLENKKDGKQFIANKLPYVIITEGQICAISSCEYGYYAIAARPYNYVDWEKALRKVDHVFLAQGNDEQGRANNAKFKAILGKKSTEMIFPISIKDMNDELRYGDYQLWLNNYGIRPVSWETIVKISHKSKTGLVKQPEEEIL